MTRFLLRIADPGQFPAMAGDVGEARSVATVFDQMISAKRCSLAYLDAGSPRFARDGDVVGLKREMEAEPKRSWSMGPDDVSITLDGTEVAISCPLNSVRQVYYARRAGALTVSDDPRLLVQDEAWDARGLLAHLELVAPVAPFTPWLGISRIPPGTEMRVPLLSVIPTITGLPFFNAAPHDQTVQSDEDRIDRVGALLDAAIEASTPTKRGIVFYSGGVDSTLIAARAAAMGWQDVVLAHSTRGAADAETEHARRIADILKLEFRSFEYDPAEAIAQLSEMFDAYAPVNDFSILPTWALARRVVDAFPACPVVWDGSAADALFGGTATWDTWRRVYRVPNAIRRLVGGLYSTGELWRRSGNLEDRLRLVRRSAFWPFPAFALTSHPLAGIAYRIPGETRAQVARELIEWLNEVATPLPSAIRPKVLGIVFSNAGGHCQKPLTPVERAGIQLSFPFLSRPLVNLGLTEGTRWPENLREDKGVLKRLLGRSIPAEFIYRPKSGFSIPPEVTFSHPAFLAALDEVLEDSSGPFFPFLVRDTVVRMRAALRDRRTLAWFSYEFLWALAFGHHWITRATRSRLRVIHS